MSVRSETHKHRRGAIRAIALIGLSTCVGGQTGDGAEGGGDCAYRTLPVDNLDEANEFGFSAQDVLNFITVPRTSSFAWRASPFLEFDRGSLDNTFELELTHVGGARIRRPVSRSIAHYCPPALELDTSISLESSARTFAGEFPVVVVSTSPDAASFRETIDAEGLGNGFEILGTTPSGGVLEQFTLDGVVTPLGTYGDLDVVLSYGEATSQRARIVSWPDTSACLVDEYFRGLVVAELTDLGGYTPMDALSLVNGESPATLTWDDGSRTEVKFSVVAAGAPCATVRDGWDLRYGVTVTIASADGRWQGSYSGGVSALPYEGVLNVNLQVVISDVPAAQFAAKAGLPEMAFADDESPILELNLGLDVVTGLSTGEIRVDARRVADCVRNPLEPEYGEDGRAVSTPPCEGTASRPLLSGSF